MDESVKIYNKNEIILLDDSPSDRLLAHKCYDKSQLKNKFLEFGDGPNLLKYLELVEKGEKLMPALVLLDINMPGMDGFEVLDKIRKNEFFKKLPLLAMLTSSNTSMDISRAKALGADRYFVKPMGLAEYVELFNSLATDLFPT